MQGGKGGSFRQTPNPFNDTYVCSTSAGLPGDKD